MGKGKKKKTCIPPMEKAEEASRAPNPSVPARNFRNSSEMKEIGNSSNVEAKVVDAPPKDMVHAIAGPSASLPVQTNASQSQRTWSSLFKHTEHESCASKIIQYSDKNSLAAEEWSRKTEGNAVAFPTTKLQPIDEWLEEEDDNAAAFPTTKLQPDNEWLCQNEGNVAVNPTTELQPSDEWSEESEDNATELQTSNVHTNNGYLDAGACSGKAEGRGIGLPTSDLPLSDIQALIVKLMNDAGYLKDHQRKQDFKNYCLKHELEEAKLEMLRLRKRYSKLDSSSGLLFEEEIYTPVLDSDDCILVVGGNDGSSWLTDFSCYSPSRNLVKNLSPMTSVRTYTSAAIACGELYVLGGKLVDVCSDIVESYNPASNEWCRQPSLNQRKGSLTSVSIQEKVYAIGGGNETGCLFDVEMLDISIGKWIISQPMQHNRFDPAVANINDTLYVVGGFDGRDYLKSVERFDPREKKWTLTGSMSSKRACHSVIALNEKIYGLGCFNGTKWVSDIEVFEPRVGLWIKGESMNVERGYFGAAALGGKYIRNWWNQ